MWWKQFKSLKIQFSPPFCSQEKIKSSILFFITKINDKLIVTFYYFSHWKRSFVIFSFTNWFSHWVLFIAATLSIISQSPSYLVPASRVIIAKETPDPSFVIKIRRQEIVAKAAAAISPAQRYLISQKIKSENNLWKSWKEDNDSSQQHGLTLVLTPGIIQLNHYLWDSSFSDHATSQRMEATIPKCLRNCFNLNEKLSVSALAYGF